MRAKKSEPRRGQVYLANLNPVTGSEQGGERPVLVIQNNIGNQHSPTIIVSAITSQMNKARLPTHVTLPADIYGLDQNSVVLLEQIRTIDKKRLKFKMAELDDDAMEVVDNAIKISMGLLG